MKANRLVGVTLWRVFVAAVGWFGFDQITDASRLLAVGAVRMSLVGVRLSG